MRTAGVALVGIFALAAAPEARPQERSWDLGIGNGAVGAVPAGWFVPPVCAKAGFTAKIAEDARPPGSKCVVIARDGRKEAEGFGNLMRMLDPGAFPVAGKRIRLRASLAVDAKGAGSRAQLWMRVDRAGGRQGFFDNMGDRPVTSPDWREYAIDGEVAADAAGIAVGLMVFGDARARIRDVSIEIAGDAEPVGPPRPLSRRGLENIVAFARLFGLVRHFHPSDAAAVASFEDLAIDGIAAVEGAADAAALAKALEAFFRSVAPSLRVFQAGRPPRPPAELGRPRENGPVRIVRWRHRGFGQGGGEGSIYRSDREWQDAGDGLPEGFEDPGKSVVRDLGGGVACLLPLALFADAGGTLPRSQASPGSPASRPAGRRRTGDDRATRLGAVVLAWNIFRHFYPYFDVVKTDWAAVLGDALEKAATDAGEHEFTETLRLLVAALHDGHGSVVHPSAFDPFGPPVRWDWIEETLVVTVVDPRAGDRIARGDVVLKIDGRPAAAVLEDAERLISGATPEWRRFIALRVIGRAAGESPIRLEVASRKGGRRMVELPRGGGDGPLVETRPAKISEVRPGTWYVDIDRITDEDFRAALPDLAAAKGLVFDLRGYPGKLSTAVIAHLTDRPVTSAQWHVPDITKPDGEAMAFTRSQWTLDPAEPRLRGRAAFITDARAISYAETWLGIIEHYRIAEIVGGRTAGTNGNVNPFVLPGGFSVSWTGMKVLKHDGSRHHGVGILPTIPVKRTRAGVAEGKDELLERAIEVVSRP